MGRRTDLSETGSAYSGSPTVGWGYNTRGELTLQNHSNNSYDSAYEFDNVGNRRKASGTTTLPGSDNHTANSLNQYTSIGGVSPSYDFADNLIADAGGNTSGSSRTYTWDGENRLVKVTTVSGGATLGTYRYDPMGRRYAKTADGATTWFLYNGWNVISEIQGGGQVRAHLWGLDLSGSAQGAGGVGGLLCSYTPSEAYRPLYDGNGNIVQYVTSSGSIAASYEYSPFGHLLATSGTAAPYLSYRFSTKYRDPETDFYCYGYRCYSSWMARWISKDPLGENGGDNLYGIIDNNPICGVDYLGLSSIVIIGGVATGHGPEHDRSPLNFINNGTRKALSEAATCWKGGQCSDTVYILLQGDTYDLRIASNSAQSSYKPGWAKDLIENSVKKYPQGACIKVITYNTALELRGAMNNIGHHPGKHNYSYFGHSNPGSLLLDFGARAGHTARDGRETATLDGIFDYKMLPIGTGGKFSHYGCFGGDGAKSFCKKASERHFDAEGAIGKTDYSKSGIVGGPLMPTAEGGYVQFPAK